MRDVRKPPSRFPSQKTWDGIEKNRSRPSMLEGLQIGNRKELDADVLLCRLSREDEQTRADIFHEFAALPDERTLRRNISIDLIVALREGNTDAALALGHMRSKEGISELQNIVRNRDGSKLYRECVRALCMYGKDAHVALDEIFMSFMEDDGLESETADALIAMGGISLLCTVVEDRNLPDRKKAHAAASAIARAGAEAVHTLPILERRRVDCIDRDLKMILDNAVIIIRNASY